MNRSVVCCGLIVEMVELAIDLLNLFLERVDMLNELINLSDLLCVGFFF